jgi:hypothetical protein
LGRSTLRSGEGRADHPLVFTTVSSFIRAQEVRALLEACALGKLISALEILIESEEERAATDVVAEHALESLRRRHARLKAERASLIASCTEP